MTRLLLTIGIVLTLGSSAALQTRPNFSGTWQLDEERSISPTYAGYVGPVVWVVTQSPDTMTVEIRRGTRAYTIAFSLAGLRTPSDPPPDPYPSGHSLLKPVSQHPSADPWLRSGFG